jgi:hypothetical protein
LTEYSNNKFLLNKPYKNVKFKTVFLNILLKTFKNVQINPKTGHSVVFTQFGFILNFLDFLKFWAKISHLLSKINIRLLFEYSNISPELFIIRIKKI